MDAALEKHVRSNVALIAPSVLACDFANLANETRKVLEAGADWIHLDVLDGHFAPNISFGAPVIKCLRAHIPKGSAFFDCHLMVSDPAFWIDDFVKAGVDQFTFHFEAVQKDPEKAVALVKSIREAGMYAGISIKPKTSLREVAPVLDSGLVTTLLVMTVEPGFGGQKFMPDMLAKIREARQEYPNLVVAVDGGLNAETTVAAARAGANAIIAGTFIFKSDDPKKLIADMRASVNALLK